MRNHDKPNASPPWRECERPGCDALDASDYCEVCGKNLCRRCMAEGHCGHYPALSGMNATTQIESVATPAGGAQGEIAPGRGVPLPPGAALQRLAVLQQAGPARPGRADLAPQDRARELPNRTRQLDRRLRGRTTHGHGQGRVRLVL